MNASFAPPNMLYAAMKALHCAAYTTRNWAMDESISRKQIYDLWEAVHEIPDILTRWKGTDTENELMFYLHEYSDKWKNPDLVGYYKAFLPEENAAEQDAAANP
jgi:hypothetical protein